MVKYTGYWTKERCQAEALKYTTRGTFWKNSRTAYNIVWKNKWLDYMCSHMIPTCKPPGYWTKQRCKKEALKYNTRTEFQKNSKGAYHATIRNNWFEEMCSHMTPIVKWTKEACHIEALKYDNKRDFQINSTVPYQRACYNKWLNDICSHMTSPRKPKGYWSKERCLAEAAKYKTWSELRINVPNAHSTIYANKWQHEVGSHLFEKK